MWKIVLNSSVLAAEASGPCSVTKFQIPIFFFRRLHVDLNLDEIKNALRLLSVIGETNLINLIRL